MGEFTDLLFSALGKLGKYFNINGQRVCFVLWAICLAYWMCRNHGLGLRVQTLSCTISFLMHMYGFFTWGKKFK